MGLLAHNRGTVKRKVTQALPQALPPRPRPSRLTLEEVTAVKHVVETHAFPVLMKTGEGFSFKGIGGGLAANRVNYPITVGGKAYILCVTGHTPTSAELRNWVQGEVAAGRAEPLRAWTAEVKNRDVGPEKWLKMPIRLGVGVHDPARGKYVPLGPWTFTVLLPPKFTRLKIEQFLDEGTTPRPGRR